MTLSKTRRAGLWLTLLLTACGEGGSSSTAAPPTSSIGGVTTPAAGVAPVAACSLRARQDWAAAQLREWYLFPETLPTSLDPAPYTTLKGYIDALTATARSQRRDRFFTYATSIAEEDAFYASGQTAGLGLRLSIDSFARRLYVTEAFEGAPGLAAGIDRGTEIVAIGTTPQSLRTVSDIMAAEGSAGVTNALGDNNPGTARVLRISNAAGTRDVSVAKANFDIPPVSPRYGARIIEEEGRRVGYLNLRTFISSADPALRTAFDNFRAQGVNQVIVDFRYNGGGLVSIAELMGDLLGGNRSTSDVFSYTAFRTEKSNNNGQRNFKPQPQSIAAMKIAFIGTGSSASASELVINGFVPYLHANAALIGTNTYGKPVGQIALDRPECDDRLRVIAFATQNSAREGGYFDGLAPKMEATCQAADDISRPLGDPQEASTRRALDYLAGRTCTPITSGLGTQAAAGVRRDLVVGDSPSTAQREVPGLF